MHCDEDCLRINCKCCSSTKTAVDRFKKIVYVICLTCKNSTRNCGSVPEAEIEWYMMNR